MQCQTQGALARPPEPEAHDKVLDNNPDRIGIWKCWFLRRGRNRRKTSRSKEENQQQTQPTYDAGPGIEHGTHWWEASALTTAPSLLPRKLRCIPGNNFKVHCHSKPFNVRQDHT